MVEVGGGNRPVSDPQRRIDVLSEREEVPMNSMHKVIVVVAAAVAVFYGGKAVLNGATAPFVYIPVGIVTVAALMVAIMGMLLLAVGAANND
jgi:hypothetical protein